MKAFMEQKGNKTEITVGDTKYLFSYKRCIATYNMVTKEKEVFQNEKEWSQTNERHYKEFMEQFYE